MRPEVPPKSGVQCAKVKIRVDFYPHLGELDYSFIAWEHPSAEVVKNAVWSHYDQHHIGMAAQDMVAQLYDHLKMFPEPF